MSKHTYKVVVLGEGRIRDFLLLTVIGRVGKTSITLKYCLGQFHEDEQSTINAAFLQKELNFDGQTKKLAIWVLFYIYAVKF